MNGAYIGSYRDGASVLHRLDAPVKLIGLLLLLAAVILTDTPIGYLVCIAEFAVLLGLSRTDPRSALSGIRGMWLFFLLIFLMNALFFAEGEPLMQWWIFRLTREGILQGMHVVARVALAVLLGNLLLTVTSPLEITDSFVFLLWPLSFFGVPVQDVAMILGVALQFIPTFLRETEMIRRAQTARGARFESRRLTERAQAFLPLIVPVFLAAFRRADELSVAMEARGYRRAKGRPPRKKRNWHKAEATALLFCLLAVAAGICL